MSRTYNIDSTRNYDIDGRTYHNTSNESRSRINSARQSDVDARNYSNAMHNTGGAKIFSFKGGGTGKLATSLFSNVIMWLVIGLIAFLAFKFLWPLIKVWTRTITPTASDAIDKANEEIAKHASDRMSNGETYLSVARWLFDMLFTSDGVVPWAKSTDKESVGNYMLTVRNSEFVQLSNTYLAVKKESFRWFQIGDRNASLSTDLKDLFNDSERLKYLSHLSIL